MLRGGEVQITGGADGWIWEDFTLVEPVGDFVADDGAEVRVSLFLLVTVADASKVEIRAVADVTLVFIGPTHKAVIAVFGFHDGESYSDAFESAMAFVVGME